MCYLKGLRCRECKKEYPLEPLYVCEYCFGPLEVEYEYESIKRKLTREEIEARPKNLWRYKELLPVSGVPRDGVNSGFTPLVEAKNLSRILKVNKLYIKDDSVNHPTLSFKDRVVAVALSKAKEFGFDTVACASTGNLANAVAAQAAVANLKSYIFIPRGLEEGKIVGTQIYNPTLVMVEGNYDQVNKLCAEIAAKYQWAFVNINIRPFYAEGSKTYGFEIIEQLGWKTPGHIIVPCAGGSLITKIWKGMNELQKVGLIDNLDTKLYAAQAAGCAPIVTAIKENSDFIKPVKPNTIAKSLAIGNPADGIYAAQAVKKSGGWAEDVSDDEIIEAIKLLAETEGIFTETAGGVTLAAARKLIENGVIPEDESIVLSITGNGLKTQEAVKDKLGKPMIISPTLASFEENISRLTKI